jgi:hypothetical protein
VAAIVAFVACASAVACGKKGPPLPPLVRLPAAPSDMTAARRGGRVELQFTVPGANTDNTHPANVERVDVYGFTGPATVSNALLLERGTRVGSVPVKAPRDPNAAVEPEDAAKDEPEPPEGPGLDQGAIARVEETLTPAALVPADTSSAKTKSRAAPVDVDAPIPLVGPPSALLTRTYVSVGINKSGRKGPVSRRVSVPLVNPPDPPGALEVTYTETAITVTWSPPAGGALLQEAPSDGVLPASVIGAVQPTMGFNVYDMSATKDTSEGGAAGTPTAGVRLTKTPVTAPEYVESRVAWGEQRCYAIRSVMMFGGLSVESDAPPAACVTLVDTFAPAPPRGLTAVATEKSVSLIWEPNSEQDLVGYVLLRGLAPAGRLEPLTTAPVQDTTFRDVVQPGIRYVYAVQAVDKAGNVSALSNRVEETGR